MGIQLHSILPVNWKPLRFEEKGWLVVKWWKILRLLVYKREPWLSPKGLTAGQARGVAITFAYAHLYHLGGDLDSCGLVRPHQHGIASTCRGGSQSDPIIQSLFSWLIKSLLSACKPHDPWRVCVGQGATYACVDKIPETEEKDEEAWWRYFWTCC